MQDFYTENYKMFLKETKEDLNKCKIILSLWTGRLNIVKIILPKVVHRFDANPTKTPKIVFAGMEKSILKFIKNFKGPSIATAILYINNKVGRFHTSLF